MAEATRTEHELQVVTGIKPRTGEPAQKYRERLVSAVADLPDASWNKLGEDAQAWYNAAAEALNAQPAQDIPEFASTNEGLTEKEKKPAKAKKEKLPKEQKREHRGRKEIIRLICIDSSITEEQIMDELSRRSIAVTKSTLHHVAHFARLTLSIYTEINKPKE